MASACSAFRVLISRIIPLRASQFPPRVTFALAHPQQILCKSSHSASSSLSSSPSNSSSSVSLMETKEIQRWRPMCLYYTHGMCTKAQTCAKYSRLCIVRNMFDEMSERDWSLFSFHLEFPVDETKMDDPAHLEIFNHDCSKELQVNATDLERKISQEFNFFLVLDLEGKVEILEFPVLIVDAKTMEVVDLFHRFVRPTKMSEQAINKYIEGKYGELGVDGVWHDTAIPFKQVVEQFEAWLAKHDLWDKESGKALNNAAFVTCGNWDLKTKIPDQCVVSNINLPSYFMEWINLKDVYLNFYGREARGMVSMMKQCGIRLMGSHHLGIDDTKNITRVVQRMLGDGAVLQITARRSKSNLRNVEFLFKNRIK